jgi:hypothetical protein
VDELYDFVFDQVRQATPDQRPGIFADVQGTLYIAQNPNPPAQVERLTLTLGPPLVQGGRTARLVATATNDGTTRLDLVLRAQVPDAGVEGRVEPARLLLEPGTGAIAEVRISPPRSLTGGVRRHGMRVQAQTTQGRRWEATAVFNQAPLLGRRLLLLLGAGAAAVVLVLFFLIDGEPRNPLLSIAGNIETSGAQDRYGFDGAKDLRVYLDVKECPATGILVWTLVRPDDEEVFKDQILCNAGGTYDQGVLTLPQAGPYRLIVHGADDDTGTYRVKIQSR